MRAAECDTPAHTCAEHLHWRALQPRAAGGLRPWCAIAETAAPRTPVHRTRTGVLQTAWLRTGWHLPASSCPLQACPRLLTYGECMHVQVSSMHLHYQHDAAVAVLCQAVTGASIQLPMTCCMYTCTVHLHSFFPLYAC